MKFPSRNNTVDIIRGFAMLMVVLQHTIAGCTIDFDNTTLFRAIWSLQMPLFFIISGYVTRYSRPLDSAKTLKNFIWKKTMAYLFPWLVWSALVRGAIYGYYYFLNPKYLLWHMDAGYWFLFSLWWLVIINGVASYFSNLLKTNRKLWRISAHLCFAIVGAMILAFVGVCFGIDFLAIKLTLFYFPLYMAGYLWGQIQDGIGAIKGRFYQIVVALSLFIWLFIILRVGFFGEEMSAGVLVLRYLASISGCIIVISVCHYYNGKLGFFKEAGIYSLQIYLLHYLFLCPLKTGTSTLPVFASSDGAIDILFNYSITLGFVAISIVIIRQNKVLTKLLFWK